MEKEIGVIGLGKMGKNIAIQLTKKEYDVVVWNRSKEPVKELVGHGAKEAPSIKEMVVMLKKPRVIWLMLPAGDVTIEAARELSGLCEKDDIVIDGSNSMYKESQMLYKELQSKGIRYLDAGCSGGPSGALNGMCIMVGGEKETYAKMESLFREISIKDGYMYIGEAGSGHFVKMVHNAIEYGMMQSIAEGLELVENGPYKNVRLAELCGLWQNGSVIRSYLVELAGRALSKDVHLEQIAPFVDDKGEGRYAVATAVEYGIPFMAITGSLYERFNSQSEYKFGYRVLAALRHEFGGHEVKTEGK